MHIKCSKYFIAEGEFPESVQVSVQITGNFIGKDDDFFFLLHLPPFPFLFPLKCDVSSIQPGSDVRFGGWDCCGSRCCVDPASPPSVSSELGLCCV